MRTLHKDTLNELLSQPHSSPAVTIYMPTHSVPTPPHMNEDQIRLKNSIQKALDIIGQRGGNDTEFRDFIEKKRDELLQQQSFWQQLTEGLLICIRPYEFTTLLLPVECEPYVAVDTHYHLAPVYGLMKEDISYFVLAIARQDPKLYQGDMYGLHECQIDLPENLQKALNIDELHHKQQHYHQDAGGYGTGQNAGRGTADSGKSDLIQYFQIIDETIRQHCDTSLMLILAGTDETVSQFKAVSRHPNLIQQTIHNPSSPADMNRLFAEAWRIVSQEVDAEKQAVLSEFRRLSGENPAITSTDPVEIVKAARQGRVKRLILTMSRVTKDTVKDISQPVAKIVFPSHHQRQLVDQAAQLTWLQSGTVHNIDQDKLPNGSHIAAVFRY